MTGRALITTILLEIKFLMSFGWSDFFFFCGKCLTSATYAADRDKLLPYLALWDASSDNQHQTTATITIIPMKGMERTGCSDGWMNLWGGKSEQKKGQGPWEGRGRMNTWMEWRDNSKITHTFTENGQAKWNFYEMRGTNQKIKSMTWSLAVT